MRRLALAVAVGAALALVAAGAAVGQRRQREAEASPLPSIENTGPRGLAAAWRFLAATGRRPLRRGPGDPPPPRGAAVVLAAPRAALAPAEVEALLAHAAGGGTLVLALGAAPQPVLERRLALSRGAAAPWASVPLAPHPLFSGLVLPSGGSAIASGLPGALPVAGALRGATALSLPLGAGEVIVLSGPEALENERIGEADAVSFLVRLGGRGPLAIDERFLAPADGPAPPSRRALALLAAQALLGAAVLLAALAPRLGPIRPPPPEGGGRSTRDYLASLAALYRRAGAEPELARSAWRAFRRRLEARAGIPARLPDAEAARLLAARSSPAARAVLRGSVALGRRRPLLAVGQAAAEAEEALGFWRRR